MKESSQGSTRTHGEGLFTALSAGAFFVLAGAIFLKTPNLFDMILAFFLDFDIVKVPNMTIHLPAPISPRNHLIVYSVATQFSFVWGFFQIIVLAFRFIAHSPLSKKAENLSNIVFWLGAGYIMPIFLNRTTTPTIWFAFWTLILMLVGVSLITRAIILALRM